MGNPSSIYEDLIVGGDLRIGGSISPLKARSTILAQSTLQAFTVPLSRFRDHGHAAMAPGAGIYNGTGTICENRISRSGGLIKTEILLDLTGLTSVATENDIIGVAAGGKAHIGRITKEVNGTIVYGTMTSIETGAGGDDDLALYSATEDSGVYNGLVTDLTETLLYDSEGVFTGAVATPKLLTTVPPADGYLYLAAMGGDTAILYTGGIFLIELWGTPAAIDYFAGAYGTDAPTLQTGNIGKNGAATTYYARGELQLPWEYEAGQSVTIRLWAGMVTAAADVAATLDIEVYETDTTATSVSGSDICLTAATAENMNNTTFQMVDFVITPTTLSPGDLLDVRIKMTLDDDSTAMTKGAISLVQLLCDVR